MKHWEIIERNDFGVLACPYQKGDAAVIFNRIYPHVHGMTYTDKDGDVACSSFDGGVLFWLRPISEEEYDAAMAERRSKFDAMEVER
jgi:hypothetical protein